MLDRHEFLEKRGLILTVAILIVVAIGGAVEIAPLFWLESTIEKVQGVRPYTPLELAGRNIYVREGCYVCHSQMIRPLKDEVERYGHYSLAAESMYDHPFQWGSKRSGPDLARVGGKYSDAWHAQHLKDPRSLVPESVMPPYAKLDQNQLDADLVVMSVKANRAAGVPYTDEMIAAAARDLAAQVDAFSADYDAFLARYPKAEVRDFGGDPEALTEMDAMIAYLQVLGTMVDFKTYEPEENYR
jgi:cytochrome c oxidase cbb3-type subunit 2